MATPYMSLSLPTPSVTPGPGWSTQLNAALTTIDAHDHTPGSGRLIRSSALSIDADLACGGYNLTALRSLRLSNHGSALALGTDVGCIFEAGGDLYYNNAAGQHVQITSGAGLNAASIGGIGGDYVGSGASVFYTSASQTFTFWQAASTLAHLAIGNLSAGGTLGVTGAATLGSTLGVTGAASLSSTLGVTGAASLNGGCLIPDGVVGTPGLRFTSEPTTGVYRIGASDLGVAIAGSLRLELKPTGLTIPDALYVGGVGGATIATGDLQLTKSGAQSVRKSGGSLTVWTVGTDDLLFATGGTNWWKVHGTTGAFTSLAGATITGLPTPSGSTDAVNKDYADAALALKAPLASPTFTGGTLTVSSGGMALTESAAQYIVKSNGALGIGTSDANQVTLRSVGVDRVAIKSTGNTGFFNNRIEDLGTPSASTDAATKGYVDGLFASTNGTGSLTYLTGWSDVGGTYVKKTGNLVVLYLNVTYGGGGDGNILTLPVGYRPGAAMSVAGIDSTAPAVVEIQALTSTAGRVRLNPVTATAGHRYVGTLTFFTD